MMDEQTGRKGRSGHMHDHLRTPKGFWELVKKQGEHKELFPGQAEQETPHFQP